MRKYYFNAKKRRKDPRIENEKRRLNNESVKKSLARRSNEKPNR
jgi:hypothetical protein